MQQKSLIKIKSKELLRTDSFEYETYTIAPSRFNIESSKSFEEILNTMTAITEDKLKFDHLSKSVVYSKPAPFYYEILYEGKTSIKFNYAIPNKHSKVLVNKIDRIFRTSSVKKCENDYFSRFINKYYCEFQQSKHFMYSLNSDYREGGLLDGIMSVLNNIQDDDSVLLQIGIYPLHESKWKEKWKIANIKQRAGEELIVHTNPINFALDSFFNLSESFLDVFDHVMGVDTKTNEKVQKQMDKMGKWKDSHMTTQKINFNGYDVQIRVYCTSEYRTKYYGRIFDSVFKILDADQELELGKIKQHKSKNREFGMQFSKQIWSTKELAHVFRLPDRRMQMDYKESLTSIDIVETDIPKELQKGQIIIGESTYKGNVIPVFWNTKDYAMATQHKVIIGLQRTGKSSYIKSYAIEAMKAGHSVFVIDTIKMCSVASDIRDFLPPEFHEKIIVLDYGNLDYLLPLSWNELLNDRSNSARQKMMIASQISANLESFIETVGGSTTDDKLSPRMRKFLSAASKLVLSQEGTNLKDILDVLQEKEIRDKFIAKSGLCETNLIVQELRRLDDHKTNGTNYSLVSGISDRYSILLNDYIMEQLLSVKPNPEIDFKYWSENGYCVLIKMPDLKFDRRSLRPLVTFIYSKIWLSMLSRGEQEEPRVTHCILDEVHSFPEVCNMLRSTCRESAKFGLSYVFTNHMLTDLKSLLPAIKSSGASFMLFKTTKENYKMLEQELAEGEVTIEEALTTKKYHSINIVNYDRQYSVFTTKAPDLIEKRFKKYDRSHLDLECSKRYGTPFEE